MANGSDSLDVSDGVEAGLAERDADCSVLAEDEPSGFCSLCVVLQAESSAYSSAQQ